MAWINLAAERRAQLEEFYDAEWLGDGYGDIEEVSAVLLAAALAGRDDRLAANADAGRSVVDATIDALAAGRARFTSGRAYGECVTATLLSQIAGLDMSAKLDWLVACQVPDDGGHGRAIQRILRVALGQAPPGDETLDGHDEDLDGWPVAAPGLLPANLVDLALCPDHGEWRWLQHYAATAASVAAGGLSSDPHAVLSALQWASRPDVATEVIYSRALPRATYDPDAGADDPACAQGFDAVRLLADDTVCYYNFAMRFAAPWIIGDGLDAFWFLRWVEADWDAAVDAVDGVERERLTTARASDCRYVITFDPRIAAVDDDSVAVAVERYAVPVDLVSFLDC